MQISQSKRLPGHAVSRTADSGAVRRRLNVEMQAPAPWPHIQRRLWKTEVRRVQTAAHGQLMADSASLWRWLEDKTEQSLAVGLSNGGD